MDKIINYIYSVFDNKEVAFKKPDAYKNVNYSQYK